MTSTSDGRCNGQTRTYDRADSVVFLKTKEAFGGLSNMAGGFPLKVNGIRILTSEALYQACRFPHLPEVQKLIIVQKSPMTAKMMGKPHRGNSRPDWDQVQVKIMHWCLRVKLAQNWATFSRLLMETGERPIVEESRRDDFWGAKPIDEQTLVGMNVLGRLLRELREEVKSRDRASLLQVEPLGVPDFRLYGLPIQPVGEGRVAEGRKTAPGPEQLEPLSAPAAMPIQASLFDRPLPNARAEPHGAEVQQAAGSMDDLRPYPAYKDSGVPWLGDVPEHWEVGRLKTHARNVVEQTNDRSDDDIYVALEHVESWTGRLRPAGPDVKFDSQVKRFQAEDVLFGKLRPYLAKVTRPRRNGVCVGEFLVLRPYGTELRAHYLEQLLRSKPIIDAIDSSTFGAKMPRADWQFMGSMRLPLPTLPEQSAIVRFLDYMDRRIRRAIRAKQKLIALLNEQKQAIIHRAVTRGLDPNVRLKPSGVEWLGDVPEHWAVTKLHQITNPSRRIMYGIVLPGPNVDDGVYIVKGGNCEPGKLRPEFLSRTTHEIESRYVRSRLRENDIVIAIRGGVGAAELVPGHLEGANLTQDAARIAPSSSVHPLWLLYAIHAPMFQEHVKSRVLGATVRGINIRDLKRIELVTPSTSEQAEIVAFLDGAVRELKRISSRAKREISLLHEYRTRLIADVVTGKLDVREVAARLPEEAKAPELVDEVDALEEESDEESGEADLDAALEEATA
jgi:type I restriction enzyme S subunit